LPLPTAELHSVLDDGCILECSSAAPSESQPIKPGSWPTVQNVCMPDPETDQDSLSDLQGELRYLLNRWDPIGVYDQALDFPPDEYDCLIGPILTRLARRDSRASFSEYLWNEIEGHFGLDPVRCGTDAFADRLQGWYAAKNVGS
jgi:hypothetical protein